MYMKKIILSLIALALLPATLCADNLRDTIPSNYGGWVNLTDGYIQDYSGNVPKMEVAIDGSTIHLCWVEMEPTDDGMTNIWYRRSTDLGKTWEDARLVLQVLEYLGSAIYWRTKVMTAGNDKVHIAAAHQVENTYDADYHRIDGSTCILYVRSDDGGATFNEAESLGKFTSELRRFTRSMIQSDGNTVVIATMRPHDGGDRMQVFFYSKDGGEHFYTLNQVISGEDGREQDQLDLQVSGTRFAVLYNAYNWYSGLNSGRMMVMCSDGENKYVHYIAPICTTENGTQVPYAYPNVMSGGNGDSYNYHPQMVLDGEAIQVMYQGNPGVETLQTHGWDYGYTLYQRSDDFGQTWSKAVALPEANGGAGTIAAKGDNVYIVTTCKGLHTVYHSHDKGATFDALTQTIFSDDLYNPSRDFHITIDPTDESGLHAYFTGPRFFFAETHDGFRTLSRNFCIGTESWEGTERRNNHSLKVCLDNNGQEHWFMQIATPYYVDGYAKIGPRDIAYRRVEAEPAPGAEDMALNLTDTIASHCSTQRVVIPMSPSLQQKQAITVECWVKCNESTGFAIATCTDVAKHEVSEYNGGWYINQRNYY